MELFKRTLYAGEVLQEYIEKEVFLSGWVDRRRDLGGLIFIDLRDRTGIVQLVFHPEKNKDVFKKAETLRSEFVISVRGVVLKRSKEAINKTMKTGKHEVSVLDLSIISESKTPPFEVVDQCNASEELRLKYRYLDLRRLKMHEKIKTRHDIIFAIREHLHKNKFYEIETPLLSKSTPEGARDFLVPSRMQQGSFYALPQSPQLYKQLLMSAGMDKYFQIARCFRDEDFRANRQPEFTQLDMEMSFIHEQDVQDITEQIVASVWKKTLGIELSIPLKRMTYKKAFHAFGSDKPDLRFNMEIQDVSDLFKNSEVKFLTKVLDDQGEIGALIAKEKSFSRSELKALEEKAKKYFGASGLLWIKFEQDGKTISPIAKLLPDNFFAQVRDLIPTLSPQDTLFIIADQYEKAWSALGKLRVELAEQLELVNNNEFSFVWITDFPLLEWSEEDQRWYAKHHPFTMPHADWQKRDTKEITARAYDLVCNGEELGGGSIRIHDVDTQKKIFELLGISEKQAKEKFGFFLDALEYGFPPHGGIALGIDRLVMLITKTDSIRDVIPFPKTTTGSCLMSNSPSEVEQKQLDELGLQRR